MHTPLVVAVTGHWDIVPAEVAGVTDESGTAFIHDNFLQKQDIEVGWIRNVMRVVSLTTRRYDAEPSAERLNYAIEHWSGHWSRQNCSRSIIMPTMLGERR